MSDVDNPGGLFQVHAHRRRPAVRSPALETSRRHVSQFRLFPATIAMTCGGTLDFAAARVVRIVPGIGRYIIRA